MDSARLVAVTLPTCMPLGDSGQWSGSVSRVRGLPSRPMSAPDTRTRDTASRRGVFGLIADSFRAEDRDFSRGPIGPALTLLAIPMVLEMSMEAIFAIVDVFWIAHLGANAIAVVGLTEAMLAIVYALAVGLGMGVTAIIARRIGAGEPDRAAKTAGQAIWLCALLGAAVAFLGAVASADLLRFMGANAAMVADGGGYTFWMLLGSASIFYIFTLNAIFRGAGDATIAMRSLVLANGINLVLDPCLIFGWWVFPELGVAGAAIATTIGRSIGVAYQFYHLIGVPGRIAVTRQALSYDWPTMRRLIEVSAGGIAQFLVAMSSWIFMLRMIATFGAAATAGFTIALRVIEFIFLPAWGLGNAAATLVGQSLGAGLPARARQAGWTAGWINVGFMSTLGIVILVFPEAIAGVFSSEADVADFAATTLRWFGVGLPLYALGMILVQAINGAGDTRTPTVLNLVCFWVVQIPLAWTLAFSYNQGMHGVLVTIVIAEALLSIAAIFVFRAGHWEQRLV